MNSAGIIGTPGTTPSHTRQHGINTSAHPEAAVEPARAAHLPRVVAEWLAARGITRPGH
jgi:hypothetical protein